MGVYIIIVYNKFGEGKGCSDLEVVGGKFDF